MVSTEQRRVARAHASLPLEGIAELLGSSIHEERLTALFILVRRFEKGDEPARRDAVDLYRRMLDHVDNWDLVDSSAPQLLGAWLLGRPRGERRLLDELAKSQNLWHRRVAMVTTQAFIRAGESEDALRIAASLLDDEHDLIHKATGWMLREVGERVSDATLRAFLERYAATMPRTALRYAIEKFAPDERQHWMGRKAATR